jgi:hypothetical protein
MKNWAVAGVFVAYGAIKNYSNIERFELAIRKMTVPEYWQDACKHLGKKDRVMKRLIAQFPDVSLSTRGDAFTTLGAQHCGATNFGESGPNGLGSVRKTAEKNGAKERAETESG